MDNKLLQASQNGFLRVPNHLLAAWGPLDAAVWAVVDEIPRRTKPDDSLRKMERRLKQHRDVIARAIRRLERREAIVVIRGERGQRAIYRALAQFNDPTCFDAEVSRGPGHSKDRVSHDTGHRVAPDIGHKCPKPQDGQLRRRTTRRI